MCLLAALSQPSDTALASQLAGWAKALGGNVGGAAEAFAPQPPQQGQAATAQGQAIRLPTPRLSGRHGGISRVLARLLQPYWSAALVVSAVDGKAAATPAATAPAATAPAATAPAAGADGVSVRIALPSEVWSALREKIVALIAHIEAYGAQWGRSTAMIEPPQAGAPAASSGGSALRSVLYADSGATRDRWRGMETAHAAARESEAIEQLLGFARRAAEAAAMLATLAPPAASAAAPAASGAIVHEPPRARLMTYLAGKLEPKLRATLLQLTLGDLIVPIAKDAHGRPVPGKWDTDIETKLPKALFMELGGAEGGGALTAALQRHCPTFFSSIDQAALKGWSLLSQAASTALSPDQRAELLASAVRTLQGVIGHIDLAKLLHALTTQRAPLTASPAASAALATIDAALAELPLAAARAADPTFAATPLLIPPGGGGGAADIADWPLKLKSALCTRLRCYRLLTLKLDLLATPPPPPTQQPGRGAAANGGAPAHTGSVAPPLPGAADGAAADGAADEAGWMRVLLRALQVAPTDALFHQAVFLHLLHTGREALLLRLPSSQLLPFVSAPPLSQSARQLWSRYLHLHAPEDLATLDGLLSGPVSPGWAAVEGTLASGSLVPRLHFENRRYVDAAVAFAELADRADASAPPPPGPNDPPLPPQPAAAAATPPPLAREALRGRQRNLEERISHISMALAAASAASGGAAPSAPALGADFVRALEENAQRAQLQLRLAIEIARVLSADGALRALLPHLPGHATVDSLHGALSTFHAQVCGALLDLNALFRGAWAARLWRPLLGILDFARPYKEYPQCVSVAWQHLLAQPPEVWAAGGGGGGGGAPDGGAPPPAPAALVRPWGELSREVSELRKSLTNEYVFAPDAVVASLEATQLAQPRPEAGAVVRMLCGRGAAARPAVPWAAVYPCYGGADRCGPLMKELWEGGRPALGAVGRQKLHLIGGLATLLTAWLDECRNPPHGGTGDRQQLAQFAASLRGLGVAADLDRLIAELDGIGALLGDNLALTQTADLLRSQLRRLLQDIASMGYM